MTALSYGLVACAVILVLMVILAVVSRRRFMRMIIRPMLELLYRKEIIGLENLPREGGCVVISNHVSYIDGILILWLLPRNVRFLVDGGNFPGPVMRWVASCFDTILMVANPKSIGRALKTAREGLHAGEVIGLFPEGTIAQRTIAIIQAGTEEHSQRHRSAGRADVAGRNVGEHLQLF